MPLSLSPSPWRARARAPCALIAANPRRRPGRSLPSSGVRALVVVLALGALSAAPPAAGARFVLGIGDQSANMLNDARFAGLGLRDSRIVVPYDVASDPAGLARYAPVLDTAHARRIRMLVAFAQRPDAPAHLPSVREYRRAVRAFRVRFPW